jgi:transposase
VSYKKVVIMELSDIIRRIRDGQSISEISRVTGRDRKTIRKYISLIRQEDIGEGEALPLDILLSIVEKTRKPSDKQIIFEPYIEEIQDFLINKQNRLKIKSVYEVIIRKHDIKEETSLSSFKRFLRTHNLRKELGITCRIEQKPGHEIQIDYGEVGKMLNPLTGKKSVVYAFIGTLCSSRHKFAEFVFKQDQKSFVESHIKMFRFFGGVTKTLSLDNLKAGVIKPDL